MSIQILEKNVVNVWGERGKLWIKNLPELIKQLSAYWHLSDIKPVDNMSYNYVAKATQQGKTPVVLKVSCDKQLIKDEHNALQHFHGQAVVKVLAIHYDLNALLLEQAIPGTALKNDYLNEIKKTIKVYVDVVKLLAAQMESSHQHTHVKQWCAAIDRINDNRIKPHFVSKAKELREFLLGSVEEEYFCHGDLHLENIIQQGDRWLAIDPKGIVGEIAFEAAAFDLIDRSEWSQPETVQSKLQTRITMLANALAIDEYRLKAWFFLRVIISAQWFVEDNGDPTEMLRLAKLLYPLL